jgi:hypothetical protein
MKQKLIIFVLILTIFLPAIYVNAGTILSTYKNAWSNNTGYINFENVIVSDTTLSGFAWSETYGWIKFNPERGGVFNDGAGNLSGSAWGEGLGWIDFSNVTISTSTGKFSGTAVGDIVGIINFDCPNYCDVRTDWSATVAVVPTTPAPSRPTSGSRSSIRQASNFVEHIESVNNPLVILPQQSGTLNWVLKAGNVSLDTPVNNIEKKTTFIISEETINSNNDFLIKKDNRLVNGSFYDVSAIDENGNLVHEFSKPIKIVLPIAENQRSITGLKLYWLNETNWSWVLIPDAVFTKDRVTFYVTHLTRFAIFANKNTDSSNTKIESSISLPQEKKAEYESKINNKNEPKKEEKENNYDIYVIIALIILAIVLFKIKRKFD